MENKFIGEVTKRLLTQYVCSTYTCSSAIQLNLNVSLISIYDLLVVGCKILREWKVPVFGQILDGLHQLRKTSVLETRRGVDSQSRLKFKQKWGH